jgi:hypothetical protein
LLALANNDTEGVAFLPSTLDDPSSFSVPSHVFKAFHRPATERLLNYGGSTAKEAVQRMQDRNNPNRLQEAVPPGLSQISHLPSEDGKSIDWNNPVEELSDTKDYGHSRKVVSRHYNEATEAIHNSLDKQKLEAELKECLNEFTVRARGLTTVAASAKGNRISMTPANSKRRKTHGTQY